MCQVYTSINSKKLPQIYTKARKAHLIKAGDVVLDYGCGKHTEHLQKYLENIGAFFNGYDKYNQPSAINNHSLMYGMNTGYECVLCNNVLNVIDGYTEMERVIVKCVSMAKRCAVFTVYEGDKTGIGKQTKKDCYQRNAKRQWYYEEIQKALIGEEYKRVYTKYGMIVVEK